MPRRLKSLAQIEAVRLGKTAHAVDLETYNDSATPGSACKWFDGVEWWAIYVCKENNTLLGISKRFAVPPQTLLKRNERNYLYLQVNSRLKQGTTIVLCRAAHYVDMGTPISDDEITERELKAMHRLVALNQDVDVQSFVETECKS
jgi:hypothetical protein